MFQIEEIKTKIAEYIKVKIDLFKIKLTEQLAQILTQLVTYLLLMMVFSIMIFMLSIGFAFLLNDVLSSSYLGFLIVSAFYFILSLIMWLALKSGKIQEAVENALNQSFEEKNNSDNG